MQSVKRIFVNSIIGGLLVLIPPLALYYLFVWVYRLIAAAIQPLTDLLLSYIPLPHIAAEVSAIVGLLTLCFFLGNFVRTRFGKFFHEKLERELKRVPFYKTIKEVFVQLLGEGKLLSCPVAVVQPFPEAHTYLVAFITEDNGGGWYTAFVPTAPNPTSGWIFILPKERVFILKDVPKEEAVRIIIGGGIGSSNLIQKFMTEYNIPRSYGD